MSADLGTVDALARLQLAARRLGLELRLCRAPPELVELVHFVGLGEVLGASCATGDRVDRSVQTDARAQPARPGGGAAKRRLRVEPGRQSEQREERVRVEEERELGDLPA